MTAKRLAFVSLGLLAVVAILSIQPWFEVELVTGTDLLIEGNAVYPAISAALFVDVLAIALFLYLQCRLSNRCSNCPVLVFTANGRSFTWG